MRRDSNSKRRGFTLIDLACAGGCLAVIFALTAPAIVKARSDARSRECANNLKQLGLALHNYHDTFNTFPPGWMARHRLPGRSFGRGWLGEILPQVEQAALYNRMNLSKPLPDPNKLLQTPIQVYRCPSDPTPDANPLRSKYGTANYSGNYGFAVPAKYAGGDEAVLLTHWMSPRRTQNWPGQQSLPRSTNGMFYINSCVRIRDVNDGTSNTLLVGERSAKSGAGIWPGVRRNEFANDQVTDCSPGNEINARYTSFSSYHPGGAHFLFTDGRVRFLSEKISSRVGAATKTGFKDVGVFQALSSRNGGEVVNF